MNIHVEKELKGLETYFKDWLHKTCLCERQPVQMIVRVWAFMETAFSQSILIKL